VGLKLRCSSQQVAPASIESAGAAQLSVSRGVPVSPKGAPASQVHLVASQPVQLARSRRFVHRAPAELCHGSYQGGQQLPCQAIIAPPARLRACSNCPSAAAATAHPLAATSASKPAAARTMLPDQAAQCIISLYLFCYITFFYISHHLQTHVT